eukprot:4075231-Prymnesium_polylepis.1
MRAACAVCGRSAGGAPLAAAAAPSRCCPIRPSSGTSCSSRAMAPTSTPPPPTTPPRPTRSCTRWAAALVGTRRRGAPRATATATA